MPSEKIKEQWKTIYKDTKSELSFLKSKAINITFDKKAMKHLLEALSYLKLMILQKAIPGLNKY